MKMTYLRARESDLAKSNRRSLHYATLRSEAVTFLVHHPE